MKKAFIVIATMLIFIVVSACSADVKPASMSADDIHVSYPKFSYPAAEEPFLRKDISFHLSETQNMDLNKPFKIYRIARDGISADDKKKIVDAFDLQDCTATIDSSDITNYCAGNKQISIYPNGVFTFEITDDTDRKDRPFDLANDKVGQMAKSFLSSRGLLPSDFVLTDRFGKQGVVFEKDGIERNVITAKGTRFERRLDGIEVLGTSKILVSMNTDGICSVYSVYSRIENVAEAELIDIGEAMRRSKTPDPLLTWDLDKQIGKVTKAVIDEVKIVYYDDPLDEQATHIQPCYFFEGKATDETDNTFDFSMIVPALEQECYLSN